MDVNEARQALEADKQARAQAALEELRGFIEDWGQRHRVRLVLSVIPVDLGNGTYGVRPVQQVEALE